jgi:hypothetical protein
VGFDGPPITRMVSATHDGWIDSPLFNFINPISVQSSYEGLSCFGAAKQFRDRSLSRRHLVNSSPLHSLGCLKLQHYYHAGLPAHVSSTIVSPLGVVYHAGPVDTTILSIVHFVSFECSVGMILVLVSTQASCMSRPNVRSVAVTAQTRFAKAVRIYVVFREVRLHVETQSISKGLLNDTIRRCIL